MYVTYCHTSIKIWNFTPETQLSLAFFTIVYRYNAQLWFKKSADGIAC